MDRLGFLKRLLAVTATAIVAPSVLIGKEAVQQLPSAVPLPIDTPKPTREPMLFTDTKERGGVHTVIGGKGCGKTHYTKHKIKEYISGNNPRKVLIFDVNDEYGEIQEISENDLITFSKSKKIEARRISLSDRSLKGRKKTLEKILHEYNNGHLIIETPTELTPELMGAIATTRHFKRPTTLFYQGFSQVPPKIWQNTDVTTMFKVMDIPKKDRFPELHEPFEIMQNIIRLKNKYSDNNYLYFDNSNYKILGDVTEQWDLAVEQYKDGKRKKMDSAEFLRYID